MMRIRLSTLVVLQIEIAIILFANMRYRLDENNIRLWGWPIEFHENTSYFVKLDPIYFILNFLVAASILAVSGLMLEAVFKKKAGGVKG